MSPVVALISRDTVVPIVGDEQVALPVDRETIWVVQLGRRGGTAVPSEARRCVAPHVWPATVVMTPVAASIRRTVRPPSSSK